MKTLPKALRAFIGLVCLLAAGLSIHPASSLATGPGSEGSSRALIVLVPADSEQPGDFHERFTARLATLPGVAIGLLSATQGPYSRDQALLDITQGTRVSRSTYDPTEVPPVELIRSGTGARLAGWEAILARAATAPQSIEPGLLSGVVPGGAALIAAEGASSDTALPAADRMGRISFLRQAPARSVGRATEFIPAGKDLGVIVTAPGGAGLRQFEEIVRDRGPKDLVIGMEVPPSGTIFPLLGIGVAGLATGGGELTSRTTTLPGMVAGIDIAPTVLVHLGLPVPSEMTGQPMSSEGDADAAALDSFRDRLREVIPRRAPVLVAIASAWLILFLAAGALLGRDRARLPVRRIGGLAILWLPFAILVPAALGNPPRSLEPPLIALLCILLGFLSDRLMPWPRATILPAAFGIGAITIDLAMGSDLIIRSVWGSNPGYGSRFYGIGNELQSGLPVLLLAGVAGLMGSRGKSRQMALAVLAAGLILGAVIGSGRLGASVGASITIAASCAVAAVMVLPGQMTGRRIALVVLSPVIGLALLAGLDLLTSGGEGHYIRNVIQDGSLSSLAETVERRATLAWQQLWRDGMALVTLISILVVLWAIRNRSMYMPFHGPIWPAALVGGLAGGVIGSLTEDSGPVLLAGAVLILIGISAYLLGRPTDSPGGPRPDASDGDGAPDQLQAEEAAS